MKISKSVRSVSMFTATGLTLAMSLVTVVSPVQAVESSRCVNAKAAAVKVFNVGQPEAVAKASAAVSRACDVDSVDVGLYGPKVVTAGQEVSYTAAFDAFDKAKWCFLPDFSFSDDEGKFFIGFRMCDANGGMLTTRPVKRSYELKMNTDNHTFDEPGEYTLTVKAGQFSSGKDDGGFHPAKVKGAKSFTMKIQVLPSVAVGGDAAPVQ